jgi:Flp pilus assembly protein TadG
MRGQLKEPASPGWCAWWRRRDVLGEDGSVAVELGLIATLVLVPLLIVILDFGMLLNNTEAIAVATRIGAEYSRNSSTCQAGYQSSTCTTNIWNAMQNSMSFSPSLAAAPVSYALTCQCDDGTSITCGTSCATAGRPTPNRVYMTITASQTFTPLVSFPGIPTTLNGVTDIRIQ